FTVAQPQVGGRVARADLVGQRVGRAFHFLHDVADFEPDLYAHLVIEVDERLDLELEADVEIGHRLGDEAAGRRRGGSDHRHAVADVDARLLLVLHPDARIGEDVGAAVRLVQVKDEQRIGEGQAHQVRVAVLPFAQRDAARGAGGPDQADGERVRV